MFYAHKSGVYGRENVSSTKIMLSDIKKIYSKICWEHLIRAGELEKLSKYLVGGTAIRHLRVLACCVS